MTTGSGPLAEPPAEPPPLHGFTVVEFGEEDPAVQLAGKLLADLGARVHLPGASPPEAGDDRADYEWRRRHGGKHVVPMPPNPLSAVDGADVVLIGQPAIDRFGLDPATLAESDPRLVVAAVTPFGQTGPLAGRSGTDLLVQAASGIASTNGAEGEPPLAAGVPVTTVAGALNAATAVVAALYERHRSGLGQLVDIGLYDAAVCWLGTLLPTVFMTGRRPDRIGNRHAMTAPWNAYPTADGWIVLSTMGESLWRKVATGIGRPDLIDDPRFADTAARVAHAHALDEIIAGWTARQRTDDVLAWCEAEQIPAGRIPGLAEALADPQVATRPVLVWPDPAGPPLPGPPVALGTPDTVRARVSETQVGEVELSRPVPGEDGARSAGDALPLSGVRVVELGAFTAGPLAGRLLAALGADVLKVEPPKGENSRHLAGQVDGNGYLYYINNTDKRGAVAELADPDDRARLETVLGTADVLLTNLSDEVLTAHRLDAGSVRRPEDRLIYCGVSGYGQRGPRAHAKAFDSVIQAYGGAMSLTGWPDGPPLKTAISLADVMAASVATLSVLCALHTRRRTGRGCTLDVALLDPIVWCTQQRWVELFVDGTEPARLGNRHPTDAPHGIFACADGWVALHVCSDEQWPALAAMLGEGFTGSEWTTAAVRRGRAAELDEAIATWTRDRTAQAAAAELRAAGVPAEPVRDLPAVVAEPHTAARGLLISQTGPAGSAMTVLNVPWKFARSPVGVRRPAPSLAEQELTW